MSVNPVGDWGWQLGSTEPGLVADPAGLSRSEPDWVPAEVPGTVASSLRAAGLPVADVEARDWWLRGRVPAGVSTVRFGGLATLADVWVDGTHVLHSENMFRSHDVPLPPGAAVLTVRFAALGPVLARRYPRPRWRTGLVASQHLRWYRTSLLGRMPGWSSTTPIVGAWRPVTAVPQLVSSRVSSSLDGTTGLLDVAVTLRSPGSVTLLADGVPVAGGSGTSVALQARLPDVPVWWPAGLGAQHRVAIAVDVDGVRFDLGHTGFRTVTVDESGGGFALAVNGVPVFCGGSVWMPLDPTSPHASDDALRAALQQVRDGGQRMLRVPGTGVWEDERFLGLCDELGILVWQDCMFATLDYPDDEAFVASVTTELTEQFDRLSGHPCVAVVSGGSETEQQPAFLGLPVAERALPLQEKVIRAAAEQLLPGIPYLLSSPTGGDLPTDVGTGVAHYFGVGAYRRPLSDLRTAGVRFAAECLAFSIPPSTVDDPAAAGHLPAWKAGVPRDSGASWDFEDVRDHYVRDLFGVDPAAARFDDPEHALDLGRAALAHVFGTAFAEWRRPGSGCAGALVLSARDLVAGAGWGLVDASGVPKAPWYALRRALAPVALLVTDRGLDGLALHVLNDTPAALDGTLSVRLFSPTAAPAESASAPLLVPAHGGVTVPLSRLLGGFRDVTHAHRFGPAGYDVLDADFTCGSVAASSTHLTLGPARAREHSVGLGATATAVAQGEWRLVVGTRRAASFVALDVPGFTVSDSWFHLPPNGSREVTLTGPAGRTPVGTARALNAVEVARIMEAS